MIHYPANQPLKAFLAFVAVLLCIQVNADVRLPAIFQDHMVVQRDHPLRIWGTASPREKITVTFSNASQSVTADKNGKWKVAMPAFPAGGPFQMVVEGNNTVTLTDVLVGDVWICGGQSNMQWKVEQTSFQEKDSAFLAANQVRFFSENVVATYVQGTEIAGSGWKTLSKENIADFSAVGYHFGRSLQKATGVPMGLISANLGATSVETWMSNEALLQFPQFEKEVAPRDASKKRANPSPFATPGVLFNGMIAPLTPLAIKGAIFYQGESNADRAYEYRQLFSAMIRDWRKHWGQGDFPFLFVQLANYTQEPSEPAESAWAELREAQALALVLPNTGMASAIDIGDANDIHPRNKVDVGKRLALAALKVAYGKDVVASGPIFRSMQIRNNTVVISFDQVGGGLVTKDKYGYVRGFQVAGADKEFHWAKARIDGNQVVVSSNAVKEPVAVRYAWADNPGALDLYNVDGLPALPFRTDTWEGCTYGKVFEAGGRF